MILQISTSQLSFGTQGDDVARVHQAIQALGRSVPVAETASRILGAGTVAVLKAIQADLGMPATGVVDAATVRVINAKLSGLDTDSRVVRGSVRDANGNPFTGGFVQIFGQGLSGEQAIGESRLAAPDGTYEVSYQPPPNGNGRVDLRLAVLNSSGPVETTPSGASILTDAGPLEVVNFVLSGEANQPLSEFELIVEDLKPLVGDRDLADLTEDEGRHEISLLAIRSGYAPEQVTALVVAHRLEKETGTPAPVSYGLFRQGMPRDVNALHATSPGVRLAALQASTEQGIVPKEVGGKKIEDYLPGLAPPSPAGQLQGLLGHILNADELDTFVDQYLEDSQDPDAFWRQVAADPAWANRADELKLTVQVAGLVNNHEPLVARVLEAPDIREASDLVRVTEEEWESLVQTQGVGVPVETPGASADEKAQNYVRQIIRQVEAAFPTRFLAERLGTSPVATFLEGQPSYDLKTTYPEQFFKMNPAAGDSLTPQDRDQLRNFQRLYRLTSSAEETIALAQNGVRSAYQISRADPKIFAEQNQEILPAERAKEVHGQALRTNAIALALLGEHGAGLNRTGLHVLPKLDVQKQKDVAENAEAEDAESEGGIPDWETLFGGFDFCACEECSSAHGPAAYFVDVLNFLSERQVKDALFARRPDLGDIELSCENTNTVLPLIDLVNEVLENAVAPPPPFAPLTLAPALEADLGETIATDALVAAFDPPLQPGTRVEAVETGERWRIWDEPFAYNIVKENNDLKVVARSRQTTGSTEERRATPQYRNGAAYNELGQAVYPWNLPFDLPTEEANVFLKHLGVSRRDLIEALRPAPEEFDPNSPVIVQLAAERIGLTDTERKIIVDEPLVPPRQPVDFWGGVQVAALETVSEMLDRSGLGYAELESLLATWFINPGQTVTISAEPDVPVDTCDTTRLQIGGLTADVLSRMHRFIRLWRKLGWTVAEVDNAIRAFTPGPDIPSLTNEVLVRLDHLVAIRSELRMTVAQALALWEEIDTEKPHATMARQLRLSVQDLLTALELTGINPFEADHSQDTLRFVGVVRAIRNSGFGFAELDYLIRHRFNPAASFVPTEQSLEQTLTDLRASLLKIDAQSDAEEKKLRESSVIDRVSAALALPADVTGNQLERVSHGSETALERFLELSAIDDEHALSRANAGPQFETLEKLLKIATILQTLELPPSLLDWLFRENAWLATAPDPPVPQVPLSSWFSLIQLQQLRRELTLEDAALEAILDATSAVAVAANQPAREEFEDALSQWLGWAREDVETLVGKPGDPTDTGLLNAIVPDDYRGLGLILNLQRAMGLLKRLGVTAVQASEWCEAQVTDTNAKEIRSAARARHDDEAWPKLAAPLQDALRDKQREALVAYLVARPAEWTTGLAKADANDLLSHFLIDVEMTSCQLTSRIKQAIGSVQLFAQRCLMGLERNVQTNDGKWLQWEWMKNFRVWEANRKIWLYPENWIEPELRDGKTPFFKDLENELLQADLDDAAAEQALLHYLEKLDEVARLEMVGVYEDDEDKALHVFGRTFHAPHVYYYRRRDGATHSWTPWEKVELDIEGDHLIPVMWNRRLMVIWPIFTEKAKDKEVEMPGPKEKLKSADRYWEIQLAWSEYQHGRWSGKNLSEAVTFEAYQDEDNILFGKRVAAPQNTGAISFRPIDDGDIPDLPEDDGGDGGDSGGTTSGSPSGSASTAPRRLVSKELISFKALAFGDTLVIRGHLRRDYRAVPVAGDSQIACSFGEFRFSGCRKIVTTAHRNQMTGWNFALAPTGTKFDRMWFTQTGPKLNLFDGKFPVYPKFVHPETIFSDINEHAPIFNDPSDTLENKLDIEVLDRTPSTFRLLAPHQDLQFICDRPFFFMDGRRAFMVTSTGSSGRKTRPDLGGWVGANVATAWRADYFPPDPALPNGNGVVTNPVREAASLTVLAPGPGGRRIAREIVPVNLRPEFSPRTLLPIPWTTREYRFENFHHPFLCDFEKTLNRSGIAELLSFDTQNARDTQSALAAQSFDDNYDPEPRVLEEYPEDEVEFQPGRAYEIYNWELFFHIPLLIAERLKANQRFAEAQRWFHFVFDPTGASGGAIPQRYWRTKPFHDRLQGEYESESVKTIEKMAADGPSEELRVAVDVWRNNPFSPHAVARLRTTAYQKTVVMKYIDNLISWGDQLFRRETLESINEAMQLYVMAAEILGRRPEVIERNLKPAVETFNSLEPKLGLLGNALEQIELLVSDAGDPGATGDSSQQPDLPSNTVLYFCVPENDRLLGYWSTVSDRLFKIRHCMNIEGQVRQLPLFEPPIDPALLVRARAAGLSIGEVLSDVFAPLPNYRFSVMTQKANELVAEVRNLGAGLLSALEKRDAEALSLLRSGQEMRLLEAVRDVRVRQVDEAEANIAALDKSHEMAQARKDYYDSREKLNTLETTSLFLLGASAVPIEISAHLRVLAGLVQKFGTAKFGSPTTAGFEVGGYFVGVSIEEAAIALDAASSILNIASQATGRMADHGRRKEDWDHQANLATIELKQIDQQLIAAEIRLAVAEQELRNHDRQIENAHDVDRHLHDKFTNQDLYQWMIGQVSGLYFQSYQLAYELAKRAERCFRFELGLQDSSYISFGYWDSLKKGLLSGEKLQYDLHRLETAYLEQNSREFELTKHVSLALLDPLALVQLRETGRCDFHLPEEIFDLDYPGHYFRRIKSVSLTLPCVVGPYTPLSSTLRLQRNSIRINTRTDGANGYPRNTADGLPVDDARFVENNIPVKAIAASNAQNDSGVFELSFRDERYLPFEGAGAVSEWSLELFSDLPSNNPDPDNPDFGKPLRQFDYGSISDAVVHVRYTAREDTGEFKNGAVAHLRDYYFGRDGATPSLRMLNLRQEFPTQWHRFLNPTDPADGNIFELEMAPRLFPMRDLAKTLKVDTIWLLARCTDGGSYKVVMTPPLPAPPPAGSNTLELTRTPDNDYGGLHFGEKDVAALGIEVVPTDPPVIWQLQMSRPGGGNLEDMEVEDALLVLGYEWE